MNKVHIKIADKGWILEKCAKEIIRRGSNISVSQEENLFADVQYYINYSARTRRVSPVEIAFFTHSEQDPAARRRYFEIAADVDHCVCMAARYAQELIDHGIAAEKISIIAPGVDLSAFKPKVRIGIVGRTYHTGRKGEGLVAQLMDVPGIEWCFTGSGWPGPALQIPDGGMPDFYNSLDYVLVPALYEGGPMSVLEGLACGVPIISSDVGWAFEYPHIPFETGNAASLRRVLEGIVAEREALSKSVLSCSWDAWAEAHLALFNEFGAENVSGAHAQPIKGMRKAGASLVLHGTENKALGGPSVRAPRTALELTKLGFNASLSHENDDNYDSHPVSHVFNVWTPESCFNALDRAKAVGKKTVLSPIFLNLANLKIAQEVIPKLFSEQHSDLAIDAALMEIAHQIEDEPNLPVREPFEGYHAQVRACIDNADEIIVLSEYERRCLEHLNAQPKSATIVRNPVDAAKFAAADPNLFAELHGLDDYILCVGRIEARKNQLILAHAARTLGRKVVFVGHAPSQDYYDLVREAAGEYGLFIPRIDPADPLLPSAIAGASVFCLPSWAEGAPLAALEAAAAGAPMVLSDRSSEKEYFGDFAEYVNPADIQGLRDALERAAAKRNDTARRDALRAYVSDNFNWGRYASETAAVYEKAAASADAYAPASAAADTNENIYFDLTTTFHASGHPTGIARVEVNVLQTLITKLGRRLVPIAWNSRTKSYLRLSHAQALIRPSLGELEIMEAKNIVAPVGAEDVQGGGRIIVVGGSWIRNGEYIAALQSLKSELGANLSVLVHDLIQMKLAHLYPVGVGAEFEKNACLMVRVADDFLVYSDCSHNDLHEFLLENGQIYKKISRFRLGEMIYSPLESKVNPGDIQVISPLQEDFSSKSFAIFVSSIEIRKNHTILINVWRRIVEERGESAPHLVFIGRTLWRGDEVVDTIRRDPKLRPFIHVLNDVDDSDLDWFYRNCSFTVFPSLYEGWGLPVAESLSYGKLCITSSATATREIAPELTELLDPYDFKAWYSRILFYFDSPLALKRIERKIEAEYQEHGWDRSVEGILEGVATAPNAINRPAPVFAGQVLDFSSRGGWTPATLIRGIGWGQAETGGRWSIGPISKLRVRYLTRTARCFVRLQLHAFMPVSGDTRKFTLLIDGKESALLELSRDSQAIDLEVPVRDDRGTEIALRPMELLSPKEVFGTEDDRQLGVYVKRAAFADELADLPLMPPPPPVAQLPPEVTRMPDPNLSQARELLTLRPRFIGSRPRVRLARMLGLDRIWLRWHARQFKRAYTSLDMVIDYLENQKS